MLSCLSPAFPISLSFGRPLFCYLSGSLLKAVSPSAAEASSCRGIVRTCPEVSEILLWRALDFNFIPCSECNLFSAEDFGK